MERLLTCALLLATEAAAVAPSAQAAPNVLLITSEDNGPELSCYGDPFVRTPHLDRLAAEGVRFERAFVATASCSESRAALLTGLYPHQNGQIGLATHHYRQFDGVPNVVGRLKARGYRTGLIGKLHVNPESAFPFDDRPNVSAYNTFSRRDVRRVAEAADAFISAGDAPFFLMVNYADAHLPFHRQQAGLPATPLGAGDVAPLPWIGLDTPHLRQQQADYYNCLLRLDDGIGMLIEALDRSGKADRTLVIYLGDHGAQFPRGKLSSYESGLRVPLLVRFPESITAAREGLRARHAGSTGKAPVVREELVTTLDLVPTILEAAGAEVPPELPGRSLLRLVRGGDSWRRYVFTEYHGHYPPLYFPQRTVRDERYKAIVNLLRDRANPVAETCSRLEEPRLGPYVAAAQVAAAAERVREAYRTWYDAPPVELYDLKTDPHEHTNRADDPELAEVKERLLAALRGWQRETADPLADPEKLRRLTAEHDSFEKPYVRPQSSPWRYPDYLAPGDAGAEPPGCGLSPSPVAQSGAKATDGRATPRRTATRTLAAAGTGAGLVPVAAALLGSARPAARRGGGPDSPSEGDKLVLVENGVSRAPIVVFGGAPPYTRRAADELAEYIERISGAKPTVIEGEPKPPPERAIWVGFQPKVAELFPALDFELARPEEILIAANAKHLVVAGRDRWDPEHREVEGIDEKIVGKQREYGTANAVYTFLQEHLGVRWLWPGELGEDVARQTTIAFSPFERRYHPPIRSRGGVFTFSRLGNRGYGRAHDWTRRQRLQLDSLEISGGHAFGDWWERFHATQPELFALQPDGTRSGFPQAKYAKLCPSNPAVWKQWLADVDAQLRQDPTRTVFNASPNDGWYSGHCVCENCTAWDHPDGERRSFHWHQHREERPALSDRHVTFANRLGRLLEQRYPGRDYFVQMLSYGHSRPAPIEARPDDNVIMVSVANFFGRTHLVDRGSTSGTTHREQFAAWSKLAERVVWRPNTGSPAGWQQGLPDLSIAQTVEDLKFVAAHGCIGIYIDSVWEHWATQGPQYYVMAQLIWDPSRDGQDVLDDYYARAFGPAADEVRGYFELLEQARMAYVDRHGYATGALDLPRLYTADLLDRGERRLQRAAEKVQGVQDVAPVYRRRVAFVEAGLAYTRLLVENIDGMRAYWTRPDEKLARRVKENWQRIERLCEEHPGAINWGPIRPQTPRMLGLHPDHPHPRWKSLTR